MARNFDFLHGDKEYKLGIVVGTHGWIQVKMVISTD
jgi:hypothetical protein